jgi:hypothetical protein
MIFIAGWLCHILYFGKDAVWHVLPSSGGVTADFFTPCREKMRHGGEKLPYERKVSYKNKKSQ